MAEPSTRLGANGVELQEVAPTDTPPAKGMPRLIDHIAHSEDLALRPQTPEREGTRCVGMIFPKEVDGTRLSDHTGVWLDLKLRNRPASVSTTLPN